jgi:hypothetical protein
MLKQTILAAALIIVLAAPAARAEENPPPACDDAAHHALDFWVGEWYAYRTGTDTLAGRSSIHREDRGCIITERWTSAATAYSGRSLNLYDAAGAHWRQFWVDSQGDVTDFTGDAIDNGVRFVAAGDVAPEAPEPHFTRMTLTRNADGTVHQLGESSDDGATWTKRYDFTYRRRS